MTFQTFVHDISRTFYNFYKLPEDSSIPVEALPTRYGRYYANYFACNSGNVDCLQDAFSLVYLFANFDQKIPNGLEILYCAGLRGDGKEDEFKKVYEKMQVTADATFKGTLISALGCTDNPSMMVDYLFTSLGDSNSVSYTQAQRRAVFQSTLQSHHGLPVVMDFIKNYSSDMINRYAWSLQQILTEVARTIKNEEDQLYFSNVMLTMKNLSGNAYLAVSQIAYQNIEAQKLPQNVAQMDALKQIYPDLGN